MSLASSRVALKARYLFPVASAPIPDGVLTIAGGKIVAVGENKSGERPHDLGNVAILPGLINAHTHLEFSMLERPLGQPGMAFPDWIREVVKYRRQQRLDVFDEEATRAKAISEGLQQCLETGTIALGEIATPGWPCGPLADSSTECTVFQELIGRTEQQIESLIELSRQHIRQGTSSGAGWRPGLSPHAPYSTHLDLLSRACILSAELQAPVAMHLAETLDEIELLMSASGALQSLLEELEAWDPSAVPRGIRPMDYLQLLAKARRSLVIHGNFLSDDEIGFLGEHCDRMSVVYCPRTHTFFGHGKYPLDQMLQSNVHVALGTDSRASNPDLNLWEEVRQVAREHSHIPPSEILRLGTLAGARALGIDHELGSLAPGKRAALVTVPLASRESTDPYQWLFESTEPPRLAGIPGR